MVGTTTNAVVDSNVDSDAVMRRRKPNISLIAISSRLRELNSNGSNPKECTGDDSFSTSTTIFDLCDLKSTRSDVGHTGEYDVFSHESVAFASQ